MFRMGNRALPPAFLAANAYATMATHTHILTHTHSHKDIVADCVYVCVYLVLVMALAFLSAWKIIHWERVAHTERQMAQYLRMCVNVCMYIYLVSTSIRVCQLYIVVHSCVSFLLGSTKLIARVGVLRFAFCLFCLFCFHIPNTYLYYPSKLL